MQGGVGDFEIFSTSSKGIVAILIEENTEDWESGALLSEGILGKFSGLFTSKCVTYFGREEPWKF